MSDQDRIWDELVSLLGAGLANRPPPGNREPPGMSAVNPAASCFAPCRVPCAMPTEPRKERVNNDAEEAMPASSGLSGRLMRRILAAQPSMLWHGRVLRQLLDLAAADPDPDTAFCRQWACLVRK